MAVAALEIGLRFVYDLEYVWYDHHQSIFCEFDELLGWRKIPNHRGTHKKVEYEVVEQFNSRGLRGPEIDYEKPEGEYRVLVLGDSYVEGYTVKREDMTTEVLREELNHNSRMHHEVINGGTGGYATDQELLFFRYEGVRYEPDFTVVMFYDNDVWFNDKAQYYRGEKPCFVLNDDGQIELTNSPIPTPEPAAPKKVSTEQRIKAWFGDHSYVYNIVRSSVKENGALSRFATMTSLIDVDPLPERQQLWVYKVPPPPEVEHAWTMTEALLAAFRDETEAAGSRFLVFYIPPSFLVYDPSFSKVAIEHNLGKNQAMGRVRETLLAICDRQEIELIDPLEAMKEEAKRLAEDGEWLYFPLDGHWTPKGHRFVAHMLAERIRATQTQQTAAKRFDESTGQPEGARTASSSPPTNGR